MISGGERIVFLGFNRDLLFRILSFRLFRLNDLLGGLHFFQELDDIIEFEERRLNLDLLAIVLDDRPALYARKIRRAAIPEDREASAEVRDPEAHDRGKV
jgi:hypothetical protein